MSSAAAKYLKRHGWTQIVDKLVVNETKSWRDATSFWKHANHEGRYTTLRAVATQKGRKP